MENEAKFYGYARIISGVAIGVVVLVLVSNLRGFFVRPSDDPEWTPPPGSQPVARNTAETAVASGPGAELFAKHCASCHQTNGKGLPGVYPPLAGSELLQGDPVIPIAIVLHGMQGEIVRQGKTYNGVMTPFGGLLSDEEIAQILTHERSSWGNAAEPVTAEMVAKVREMTRTQQQPFTEEQLNALTSMAEVSQ